MNSHTSRAKNRHPNPSRFKREQWPIGHVTFELADNPKTGATFAMIAGEAPDGKRKPLFTGIIKAGMATQMRRLARRLDEIEARQ